MPNLGIGTVNSGYALPHRFPRRLCAPLLLPLASFMSLSVNIPLTPGFSARRVNIDACWKCFRRTPRESRPDHPCRDPNWGGEEKKKKTETKPAGVKKRCCGSGKAPRGIPPRVCGDVVFHCSRMNASWLDVTRQDQRPSGGISALGSSCIQRMS